MTTLQVIRRLPEIKTLACPAVRFVLQTTLVTLAFTFASSHSNSTTLSLTGPPQVTFTERMIKQPVQNGTDSKANKPSAATTVSPASQKVVIKTIRFEGNTRITSSTLEAVAAPYLSRQIEMSDLEELRLKLTRVYTDNGYLNSGAVLPSQRVENGNVLYKIIEGTLGEVTIEGTGRLNPAYISERVQRENASNPFNSFKLQNNIRLLLNDPLIDTVNARLQPTPEPGLTDLNLSVQLARTYDFSLTASNHSAPSSGEHQLEFGSVFRNLSGYGDQLDLTVSANQSKLGLTTAFSMPLNSNDTKLRVSAVTSGSGNIEEAVRALDIESKAQEIDLSLIHPLIRSIDKTLTAGTGIGFKKSENTIAGVPFSFSSGEENGVTKLSVVRLWQEYTRRSNAGVFYTRSTLNIGTNTLDATQHNDSRPDGQYLTLQTQIQYLKQFHTPRAQLLLKFDSQLTNHQLLPLARFSLGGSTSVRGYRKNKVVRDQGIFASAEWRQLLHSSDELGSFTMIPFIDFGSARNRSISKDTQNLASIGLGIEWNQKNFLSGELYFGHSITNEPEPNGNALQDDGIHLLLRADF